MISKQLQNRALGCPARLDLSNVLESFECLSTDEYLGEDDGTLVPPLACEFCKVKSRGHILAVVDENGFIVIYNTKKTGQLAIMDDWQAHNNAVFDMTWMEYEEKILTASGDQTVVLWDAGKQEKIDVFRGHTSSVRSVCTQRGGSAVFATGSRDGHIMIWDTRCNPKDGHISPVNIIRNAHSISQVAGHKNKQKRLGPSRDSQMSVTAVIFQTDMNLFSAGTVDGCIKQWDLRKNFSISTSEAVPRGLLAYSGLSKRSHGYSNLVFDSTYSQLFVNCRDDVIYQYDVINLNSKPVHCYRGHQNGSFFIKACLSPDDEYLLTGSSDEMAYIYKIGSPKQSPVVLKGHKLEVSDVKWCPTEFSKIATLSDDNTMRIWRLHRRPWPADPGEVIGTSERTHREIGVSSDDLEQRIADHSLFCRLKTTSVSEYRVTPKVSPSIKTWLSGGSKANKPQGQTMATSKNSKIKMKREDTKTGTLSKKSIFQGNRLPCKRKLIDNDEESGSFERFNKRPKIQDSPVKGTEWKSPRKLEIKQSPRKFDSKKQCFSDFSAHNGKNTNSVSDSLQPQRCPLAARLGPLKTNSVVKTNAFGQIESISSPTVNLPNLVREGSVNKVNMFYKQSDKENSPQKLNWLSQIRQQRLATIGETAKGSPRRALFEKISVSPRSKSSQSSSSSSQSSSQEEVRSPISKGMKPLHAYFQRK
ncbi:denticleless protein homolog isoform X2 [Ostrea edulis]|uniref:denticleless protein homolog isoform X2 n=1 Tax=Ostrea edulis TaxID=37623 RepID=UPI0020944A73|nr:denticleless protein homolog isoform X2 [Ostrea edulis]